MQLGPAFVEVDAPFRPGDEEIKLIAQYYGAYPDKDTPDASNAEAAKRVEAWRAHRRVGERKRMQTTLVDSLREIAKLGLEATPTSPKSPPARSNAPDTGRIVSVKKPGGSNDRHEDGSAVTK